MNRLRCDGPADRLEQPLRGVTLQPSYRSKSVQLRGRPGMAARWNTTSASASRSASGSVRKSALSSSKPRCVRQAARFASLTARG